MPIVNVTPALYASREELVFWSYINNASPQELITYFAKIGYSDDISVLSSDFLENIYNYKSPEYIEEYVRLALVAGDEDVYLTAFEIVANANEVPPFTGDILSALLTLPTSNGDRFMVAVDLGLAFKLKGGDARNIELRERYRGYPVIDRVIERYAAEQVKAYDKTSRRLANNP